VEHGSGSGGDFLFSLLYQEVDEVIGGLLSGTGRGIFSFRKAVSQSVSQVIQQILRGRGEFTPL